MATKQAGRPQAVTGVALALCLAVAPLSLAGCASNATGDAATSKDATTSDASGSEEGVSASEAWYSKLPRASWSAYEQVDVSDVTDWYTVYKLPGNVYAIEDTSQWEEDICYLVIGEEKAVLIDTSLGISPIKPVVEKLTNLPVTVLLTHTHHDHIGGAHEFDDVWCFDSDDARQRLESGVDEFDDITYEVADEALAHGLPDGMTADDFKIQGVTPTGTFRDGDTIDLGGRGLLVVHTPGHTSDSCCFVDQTNGILFSGDTYYPADLYAFSADADIQTYAASLHHLADTIAPMNLSYIYPGHNEIVTDIDVISNAANDMDKIMDGTATDYTVEDDGYRHYAFDDGISIITKDADQTQDRSAS